MHKGIVRQNGLGRGFADLWAGEGGWPHVALCRMKRATEVHLGPPHGGEWFLVIPRSLSCDPTMSELRGTLSL